MLCQSFSVGEYCKSDLRKGVYYTRITEDVLQQQRVARESLQGQSMIANLSRDTSVVNFTIDGVLFLPCYGSWEGLLKPSRTCFLRSIPI